MKQVMEAKPSHLNEGMDLDEVSNNAYYAECVQVPELCADECLDFHGMIEVIYIIAPRIM